MELKDTIEGMTSKDYKERFIAEYNQVSIRLNKLKVTINNYDKLDYKPNTPKRVLETQSYYMQVYKEILEKRAALEGINLD